MYNIVDADDEVLQVVHSHQHRLLLICLLRPNRGPQNVLIYDLILLKGSETVSSLNLKELNQQFEEFGEVVTSHIITQREPTSSQQKHWAGNFHFKSTVALRAQWTSAKNALCHLCCLQHVKLMKMVSESACVFLNCSALIHRVNRPASPRCTYPLSQVTESHLQILSEPD